MLPEMDGLEVLRHLRASSSVPVLMLTGRDKAALEETARASGSAATGSTATARSPATRAMALLTPDAVPA